MKILHISDTHGATPPLVDRDTVDAIVHSGDMLPNQTRGGVGESNYQRNWIGHNKDRLRAWIGDRPFLVCRGNHDFVDIAHCLQRIGIDAHDLHNRNTHELQGVRFMGLRYVPPISGEWSGELEIGAMNGEVDLVVDAVNAGRVDVLVAHCPPYGLLDQAWPGARFGNRVMSNAIAYRMTRLPKLYLCGHIHEDHGVMEFRLGDGEPTMLISNAATTQRILEV